MNCPSCNITLLISDRQGIEIDYCPQCRGVWLDRGKLDKIIERTVSDEPRWHQHFDDDDERKKYKDKKYTKRKKHSWMIYSTLDNTLSF